MEGGGEERGGGGGEGGGGGGRTNVEGGVERGQGGTTGRGLHIMDVYGTKRIKVGNKRRVDGAGGVKAGNYGAGRRGEAGMRGAGGAGEAGDWRPCGPSGRHTTSSGI